MVRKLNEKQNVDNERYYNCLEEVMYIQSVSDDIAKWSEHIDSVSAEIYKLLENHPAADNYNYFNEKFKELRKISTDMLDIEEAMHNINISVVELEYKITDSLKH